MNLTRTARWAFALVLSGGIALCQTGRFPRADLDEGRFLKVLAEAEIRLAANPDDPLALAAKSQVLSSFMRFQEAEALAQRALALSPGLADAYLSRGLARAGWAIQQKNLGSLRSVSRAIDDFRSATAADPALKGAWMSLGLAYEELPGLLGGSTRQALACADALGNLDACRGDLLRGTVLSLDGKWSSAEPCFKRALTACPGNPQVVVAYLDGLGGKAARKTIGAEEQRTRLFQEAGRLLPTVRGKARGIQAVSEALLDAGKHEEAWKTAEESLASADAPSLLRLQLGKVAARAGIHRMEGLAYLDRVLREPLEGGSGGYASVHWRRGQILKDLGRRAEARKAAEAALSLDPKHSGAGKLLEDLEEAQ